MKRGDSILEGWLYGLLIWPVLAVIAAPFWLMGEIGVLPTLLICLGLFIAWLGWSIHDDDKRRVEEAQAAAEIQRAAQRQAERDRLVAEFIEKARRA